MMTFSGNRLLKRPAVFYARALGIADFHSHVHLRLDRKFPIWGAMCEIDEHEFEITINPADDCPCPLTVLAHEFVHVEQVLTGKMRDLDLTRVVWLDKVYSQEADEGSEAYWNFPWEVDARAREKALAWAYAKTFVE